MSEWIPIVDDAENLELKDHYWYLVAHKDFKTPMKAKFHVNTCGNAFEIYSEAGNLYVYGWEHKITHYMELPELPEEENDD